MKEKNKPILADTINYTKVPKFTKMENEMSFVKQIEEKAKLDRKGKMTRYS